MLYPWPNAPRSMCNERVDLHHLDQHCSAPCCNKKQAKVCRPALMSRALDIFKGLLCVTSNTDVVCSGLFRYQKTTLAVFVFGFSCKAPGGRWTAWVVDTGQRMTTLYEPESFFYIFLTDLNGGLPCEHVLGCASTHDARCRPRDRSAKKRGDFVR